jgi:hypothetical protein
MKQNIMKKWVNALRSGKYKQGKGALKQYNDKGQAQHCCLGVLCELYNDTMKKNRKKILSEEFDAGYVRLNNNITSLPKEVMEWAGIEDNFGEFMTHPYGSLADLNDLGKSFTTIATIIEENWQSI